MFNLASMKTALFGQIAFRNSDDPCFKSLSSALTTSATGSYFEDYHPLVTIENLMAISPNYDGFNVDDWAAGTTYGLGDLAKSGGITYESIQAANTGNAVTDTDWWKLPINDWLTQKVNASIMKMLTNMSIHKKMKESTKTLLENIQLFDGAGRMQAVITPSSRFVGLEITPKKINNITLVLDYIGLQFSQVQTNLKIYVFHSSQIDAIKTQEITTSQSYSFDWTAGDSINLDYVNYSNNIDSGGVYYVGYFEDDISGNAIRKRHQFSDPPCHGCNGRDMALYNQWNRFFDIRAIEVASGDLNGTSLWDISKTGYQAATNFGMNLSVSVKTDVTDLLVSNKEIFTSALGYQFAYDMLQEMLNSPHARLNRLGDNALEKAMFGIQEINDKDSLRKSLTEAMEAVSFDTSRLTQVLPSDQKPRMKLGTI